MFPGAQAAYGAGVTKAGKTGISTLESFAKGTAFQDIFEAMRGARERGVEEGMADITEKFGSQGLRFSEPLMRGLTDYRSQVEAEYGALLEDLGLKTKTLELGAAQSLAGMLQTAGTSVYQPGYAPSAVPGTMMGLAQLLTTLLPFLTGKGK
jgi:hypothetical protein